MERIRYKKNHSLGYFGADDYDPIGSVTGYKCYTSEEEDLLWVEFVDPEYTNSKGFEKRVCQLILTQTKRGVYEVDMMIIDKEFQGLGLAPRFYAYLLRKLNITLKAGSCQSPGGRSIWTRLGKRVDVLVYGKTPSGRPTMMIEQGGEMQPINGRHEAYDGDRTFEMYAVRAA